MAKQRNGSAAAAATTLLLTCLSAGPAATAEAPPIELAGGLTTLTFNLHLLEDLAISVERAADDEPGRAATFELPIDPDSILVLALPAGSYRGAVGGYLAHQGGFALTWPGDRVSLVDFELHPGVPPDDFELRATDGSLVFTLDNDFTIYRKKRNQRLGVIMP